MNTKYREFHNFHLKLIAIPLLRRSHSGTTRIEMAKNVFGHFVTILIIVVPEWLLLRNDMAISFK